MPRLRWLMIGLCMAANAINYIDRANLAVAAPSMSKELGLNATDMGLILSGFFWTYAIMQLPFGYVADRVGARLSLVVAVVWWSACTALTAAGRGFLSLLGLRMLLGVGEAGAYPSFAKVTASWFPRGERSFASSIFDSGSRVGSALAIPLVSWVIATLGWRESFIVTGVLGFVWAVFWMWLYREPENHPAVSPEDLARLRAAQDRPKSVDAAEAQEQVPWLSLFRYRTVWGMMAGFFCLNFVIYFFITWFPTYLVKARGFSLAELGTLGSLPALASIPAGWLGGFASDALYRRGWSLTAARKTCLVGGMLMSSVITLSIIAPNVYVALLCFAVAYGSLAFTAASIWALPGDVAPTPAHVASIGGIQNFASNVAGIVTTTFTGVMLTVTQGSFVIPLIVAGGFCLLGAVIYLFVVGEIAPLPVREARAPGLQPEAAR
ncbi:MFS transporter [Methylobacterium sp. J-088]|uniref:MFS transporter n=1 Tax=unclassified Methylobacterium TaxID=2615210 RepID=UPI001FBBA5BF|nr:MULTISPECIES: MFS transporter [unclassified Methylobacterium]MCJ2063860.1 MFS transporter [Methylobacterium sp. J-088]